LHYFVIAAVVGIGLLILRSKRKKSKKHLESCTNHPSGLRLYHEDSKIKLRAPHKQKDTDDSAKAENSDSKKKNKEKIREKKIAVLEFKGDIKASGRFAFSKLVDEITLNAEDFEEVVVKVESPGGGVSEYGFLYAEMLRLRKLEEQFKLTVCVDTVAASGGYLMSIPAHKILAGPFAMVGSIGVVSFIPNIREFLEDKKIKPRTFTAGNFKRTVTLTDDATPEEVAQYEGQLKLIHDQFKSALKSYRPGVDLDKVATGEAWLASSAGDQDLALVDELMLSSSYLLEKNQKRSLVYYSSEEPKQPWWKRIAKKSGQLESLFFERF